MKKSFNQYPSEKEVYDIINYNEDYLTYFIQQWVSEGIPFAFKDDPFLFEEFRTKLANRLMISPKEITMIGSARVGYSLSPPPKYGKSFNPKSDLDLSIISKYLFERCETENNIWKREYKEGKVNPRNLNEKKYWEENIHNNNNQINRGFIDSHKVPNIYTTFSLLNNSIWFVTKYLNENNNYLEFKNISIRVYKDWNCFLNQQKLNLKLLRDKLLSKKA